MLRKRFSITPLLYQKHLIAVIDRKIIVILDSSIQSLLSVLTTLLFLVLFSSTHVHALMISPFLFLVYNSIIKKKQNGKAEEDKNMTAQMMRYMTVDEFYSYIEESTPAEKKQRISMTAIIGSFVETLSERALFLGSRTPVMA